MNWWSVAPYIVTDHESVFQKVADDQVEVAREHEDHDEVGEPSEVGAGVLVVYVRWPDLLAHVHGQRRLVFGQNVSLQKLL